uniref:DUF4780 domain-containing protein n=1 Tax=Cacopsylla melanoneura TaxID=428564 RepID=A0A8D8ZZ75_9HEMI
MVSQIIKLKLTGSYAWKQSRPGAHKGGSCELTSESVTGKEITFLNLIEKMNTDKMDTSDINVDMTPVMEATATAGPDATATPPASTPTQVETAGGSGEGETADPTPVVQQTASKDKKLYLNRPKLSGTQRRKLQAQRAAERGGNAPGLKKHSTCKDVGDSTLKPASGTNETPRKRQRSQASTPSTGSRTVQKKRKEEPGCPNASESDGAEQIQAPGGGVSYSQALTGLKMVIVPNDYPETKLEVSCSTILKTYLYKEVRKTPKGDPVPVFVKTSYDKGALIMLCEDEYARTWLENKVRGIPEVLHIHVKIGKYRDVIKEHKAIFMVSQETRSMVGNDPKEILSALGDQNPKLNADDITIISVQNDTKGSTFVVSLDEPSLKVIRDRGYKIYLGLDLITIRVPGDRRANANAEGNTN